MSNAIVVQRIFVRRTVVIVLAVLGAMACTITVAIPWAHRQYGRAVSGYESFGATWQSHDMLVDYMLTNGCKWPSEWNDLQDSFTRTNQGYGAPNLDWIKHRVSIDFSFDPSKTTINGATLKAPFAFIRLANGTVNGEVLDANRRIEDFLRARW